MFELEDDEAMEVQMAPLIDCVFLLLIFFLVTSTLNKVQFELPLELPQATQAVQAAPEPNQLIMAVDAAGQIFIDGTPVTTDQMIARLREAYTLDPTIRVRVDGDRQTPYGSVIRVLDELRALGIDQIALQTLGAQDARAIGQAGGN